MATKSHHDSYIYIFIKSLSLPQTFYYRKCDLPECTKVNPICNVFPGCGHSFHIECILPYISNCPVCEATLQANVEALDTTANNAVFTPATHFEADHQSDEGEQTNKTDEDDNDHNNEEPEDEQNEIMLNNLIRIIGLWQGLCHYDCILQKVNWIWLYLSFFYLVCHAFQIGEKGWRGDQIHVQIPTILDKKVLQILLHRVF